MRCKNQLSCTSRLCSPPNTCMHPQHIYPLPPSPFPSIETRVTPTFLIPSTCIRVPPTCLSPCCSLATFYSRSRMGRWCKGETSGHFIKVKSIYMDCDRDSIIYLSEPVGPACHTNAPTCYFTELGLAAASGVCACVGECMGCAGMNARRRVPANQG
jgi:hypothetical protein